MRPDHLADLFRVVPEFRSRCMFGGHGIYDGSVIIALIAFDTLFLKTDAETAAAFQAAGCERFVYRPSGGKPVTMPYFRCPDEAFDDPESADRWVGFALAAGHRSARSKAMPKTTRGRQSQPAGGSRQKAGR